MQVIHPDLLVGKRVYVLANNYWQFSIFKHKYPDLKPKWIQDIRYLQALANCIVVCLDGYSVRYDTDFIQMLRYRNNFGVEMYALPDEVWLK